MLPRRRQAFTLLEILVVIGIIGVLVTLVVVAAGHIGKGAKEKAVHTTMENLRAMVTDRELAGGMAEINALYPTSPPATPANAFNPLPAPGDVKTPAGRTVVYTPGPPLAPQNLMAIEQITMQMLLRIPSNRQKISSFTSTQLLPSTSVPGTPKSITAPFVLDAWGNPMIYVPPALPNQPGTGYLTGIYVSGAPAAVPQRSPDGRGFWASAGPDGVFGGFYDRNSNSTWDPGVDTGYGDDNIYSFENQ